MKNAKIYATVVAVTAFSLLVPESAHAQGLVTVNRTWSFNDASGNCDSLFAGECSLDAWWTGGRAGWSSGGGNGYPWLSHDDSWNSWNIQFNASEYGATNGKCNISASVYSTDDDTSSIGEVDLWENNGSLIPLSTSSTIFGTNSRWATQSWYDLPIDQAVVHGKPVLMVFGRHQNEGKQEFIALDNVTAYCWVYDSN